MTKSTGVKGKTMHGLARSQGAAKRFAAHAQRSVQEQLALLDGRPGESRRERTRLSAALPPSEPEKSPQEGNQPVKTTARTRRRAQRKPQTIGETQA